MLDPPLLPKTLKIFLIPLICLSSLTSLTESATRTYGSSCNSCNSGPSSSFLGGQVLGNGVRGVLGNKLEHIAGFFNGLGGGGGGCGGCSSSCGSPGCGSQYVPASNPCSSGGCYSSSCSTCGSSSSSYSAPAHHSNTVTVIVQQPSSSSSSSSVYDASAYPNCQCSYLFNTHGQGNCNGQGARSYTSDRWCYVASKVNGNWVEPQWACPDSVPSDVHHGRFWSRVACDTPGTHHHGK